MRLVEVIDQFLIDCEIRGLSDETVSWYRKRLGLFARKLDTEFNVTELEDVKIVVSSDDLIPLSELRSSELTTNRAGCESRMCTCRVLEGRTLGSSGRGARSAKSACTRRWANWSGSTSTSTATMQIRVKRESGIEGVRVSAHTFRHTFAKFYLQRGGELFKLSREMGHSTVQVTEIYLKDYRSSEARREHTSYSPIAEIKSLGTNKKRRRGKEEH